MGGFETESKNTQVVCVQPSCVFLFVVVGGGGLCQENAKKQETFQEVILWAREQKSHRRDEIRLSMFIWIFVWWVLNRFWFDKMKVMPCKPCYTHVLTNKCSWINDIRTFTHNLQHHLEKKQKEHMELSWVLLLHKLYFPTKSGWKAGSFNTASLKVDSHFKPNGNRALFGVRSKTQN